MADLEAKIAKLSYEIERIKGVVGLPDDDWQSPKKALAAMGIGMSVSWLRNILQRANYAADAREDCSLERGKHFTQIDGAWLVNIATIKPVLLSGEMILPELPIDYAA